MLATFNLQMAQIDLGGESSPLQAFSPIGEATEVGGFAALLELRVDTLQQQPVVAGQVLPPDGNKLPLPEPDIVITLDDQPIVDATAAPDVDTLVAPGLKETVQLLPDDALPLEIPVVVDAPVNIIPSLPTPGPVAPGPVAPAVRAEDAGPGQAAELRADLLRGSLQSARPVLAQQQGEAQLAETAARLTTPVPAGAMAERQQLAARRGPETLLPGDDIEAVAENRERSLTAPIAAPVVEKLADAMRTRIRPGQSVTATNNQAQPAPFQPLAPSRTLQDASFASTLQQQATDLIRTPVTDTAWGDRIGERVVMLAGNQLKSAEIRLTPAELGPVRVQVSVEDGAANVTFHAQHAATRDALEQAMPRLRELLAESGLSLGQADVGEQGVAQENRDGDSGVANADAMADESGTRQDEPGAPGNRATVISNGLVDTFA